MCDVLEFLLVVVHAERLSWMHHALERKEGLVVDLIGCLRRLFHVGSCAQRCIGLRTLAARAMDISALLACDHNPIYPQVHCVQPS